MFPTPIVSNRDQMFKIFNQRISMACTAFKRPTKKLGMRGLFILGQGNQRPVSMISWSRSYKEILAWIYTPLIFEHSDRMPVCFYFKVMLFKIAQKVTKYFGHFLRNIGHQELWKITQSGHTARYSKFPTNQKAYKARVNLL